MDTAKAVYARDRRQTAGPRRCAPLGMGGDPRTRSEPMPESASAMKLTDLVPMLPVQDVRASIDFYRKLGFRVETQRDDWGWAMLSFGDCRLMLDQSIN